MKQTKVEAMKEIEDAVLNLTTSPLYEYRTEHAYLPVIGEGSIDASIIFVGEAPGKNEAKTGKPFCGAAGKILDRLLASMGIDRMSIYITNIVKDRPPENRDPTPAEIASYGPFLDRQIDIIQPKVIVTLGRYAMAYIMKRYGLEAELQTIGEAHGKVYRTTCFDIVALYHPCMAIYKRSSYDILQTDFKILKKYKPHATTKKGRKGKEV